MPEVYPHYTNQEIVERRPARNRVDPRRPAGYLVERECNARGEVVSVATLFLTNRECPFRCLVCDLWKNTLIQSVSAGDIPAQIRFGLERLPPAREIKLYNSGNFFDAAAIPTSDYSAIAELVRGFETVIVENHPNLCGPVCQEFQALIAPAQLEVAIGLETCRPQLLAALNKRMTLSDFERSVDQLHAAGIRTRVFLLLKPPFVEEQEAIDGALESIDYAFARGVQCCAVIPTRAGNGIMEQLQAAGDFEPPQGRSLERVMEAGLQKVRSVNAGKRVFVDLWDADTFFKCGHCREPRIARLQQMNLQQCSLPAIPCAVCMV